MKLSDLNPHNFPTNPEIDTNLGILLARLQDLEAEYCKSGNPPFVINSGLRSDAQQMLLNPHAPHSKHLIGAAADIRDPHKVIWSWIVDNMPVVEAIGLWFESPDYTPTWTHMQICPPKSGNRIFIP